ncbi:MAG: hypothetical protein WAM30_17480 [Candidatus Dormiibacterota bacterium]
MRTLVTHLTKPRRRRFAGLVASATLVTWLLAGCAGAGGGGGGGGTSGGASAVPATCAGVRAPHHAVVVVTHDTGTTIQRCIGFSTGTISGATLMQKSGIELQSQSFSYGRAACQIDNQPKHFTQCLPKNAPYWALYTLGPGGGVWQSAQAGYATTEVPAGGALGWRYTSPTASPAPLPATPRS